MVNIYNYQQDLYLEEGTSASQFGKLKFESPLGEVPTADAQQMARTILENNSAYQKAYL